MTGERKWVKQVRADDLFCAICGSDLTKFDNDFGANPILAEIDGRPVVAAGNKASVFYVLDRVTGEIIWSRDPDDESGAHNSLSSRHDEPHESSS